MSEQNPNNAPALRVIYSPLGEKFEVSPANYYDLTRNAPVKWTDNKPHPDTVREYCETHGVPLPAELSGEAASEPAPAPAPAAETPAPAPAAETPAPAPAPAAETPAPAAEQTTSGEAPEEVQEADQGPALKTEASDFEGMDRDAVKAYITETFGADVQIDGRKNRDGLVAQALELAAAKA